MKDTNYRGLIAWFIQNKVAANLLMMFFLVGGALSLSHMTKEIFPTIDPKMITITVPYPGASPDDVEEAITRRVEEGLLGIDGIKRITSVAQESVGLVTIELEEFSDGDDVYNDIRNEVDRLRDFPPQNAEKPVITRIKARNGIMSLAVYGDVPENILHDYAETIEQNLLALPEVSDVALRGGRTREITLEISSKMLEKYNLSHEEVSQAVANASLNAPAGRIETASGDILLRVQEKRYFASEFENVIVRSLPNGTVLKLGQIAVLKDGFDDKRLRNEYNGKPAVFISISKNATQDVLVIEKAVNSYLETLALPQGIKVDIRNNSTIQLKERANLMIDNVIGGFVLLFICLLLFLDLKLAFWISMGVPIACAGGLMLASFMGLTINMMTLFALIIVIGIVVDDAIIIGESVFYEQERNQNPEDNLGAVIRGVQNVVAPATVGVSTTIIAFVPLLFTHGTFGQVLGVIPVIVISILFISMFEAYFILPSHLSANTRWSSGYVKDIQTKADTLLMRFSKNILVPIAQIAMRLRYATVIGVICFVMFAVLAVKSGIIRTVFFPVIEGTKITATLEMPIDTPFAETEKHAEHIFASATKTLKKLGDGHIIHKNITFTVGEKSSEAGPGGNGSRDVGANIAKIEVELIDAEQRDFSATAFENLWRQENGKIAGARSLIFSSGAINSGNDIEIEMSHKESDILTKAAQELRRSIASIEGVNSVKDSFEIGKREYHFIPSQEGYAAGLTPAILGKIIRDAFSGREVTRVQRGRNEVRVMVRLPENERLKLETLENYRFKLPNGLYANLSDMADISVKRGYSVINRVDGKRIISILGDVDETMRTTDEVTTIIEKNIIPQLQAHYPNLSYSYEGRARERQEDVSSLGKNSLLSLFIIFVILAVQLRGYATPFVIIANIPIGIAGAIYSHWILGHDLSFMSLFGIVALSGVVVNDSVVLVDYYNQMRAEGMNAFDAMSAGVKRRFRAILLTTMSNGFGTLPILMETSTQAQFLIPMAISLSCGIFFSSTLLFVFTPSLMLIVEDIKNWRTKKRPQTS